MGLTKGALLESYCNDRDIEEGVSKEEMIELCHYENETQLHFQALIRKHLIISTLLKA